MDFTPEVEGEVEKIRRGELVRAAEKGAFLFPQSGACAEGG